MASEFAWSGYVNQMLYDLDLDRTVSDSAINRLADAIVEQRTFSRPVPEYYKAAEAALGSRDWVGDGQYGDEAAIRAVLIRLVTALEARQPWPIPPFQRIDSENWEKLGGAPRIATVQLAQNDIGHRLNRSFHTVQSPEGATDILLLRLRTGQEIAFRDGDPRHAVGVDLLTYADPDSTIADINELTPIEATDIHRVRNT